MRREETLATAIDNSKGRTQYDACVKRLLGQKIVLAYILKYAVPEFTEYAIEVIRDHYIEGVEIATRGVDIDESNVQIEQPLRGSSIAGMNTESNSDTEGKIFYDIIFNVIVPKENGTMKLIINVEAQKSDPSTYELQTRGVYYCARMISAQKTVVFDGSAYQKLQKVYSIWVCTNPKKEYRNTVSMFDMRETMWGGDKFHKRETYDKMAVVLLNLSSEEEREENRLLNFLEILLSHELQPAEKKRALLENYGIETTPEMEKEMNRMCNLSQGLVDTGCTIGENKILAMMQYLIANNRSSELGKLAVDKDFRMSIEKEMAATVC